MLHDSLKQYLSEIEDVVSRLAGVYNTPHFPELETFPHHKHTQTKVVASEKPSIREVIEEAGRWENQILQRSLK